MTHYLARFRKLEYTLIPQARIDYMEHQGTSKEAYYRNILEGFERESKAVFQKHLKQRMDEFNRENEINRKVLPIRVQQKPFEVAREERSEEGENGKRGKGL